MAPCPLPQAPNCPNSPYLVHLTILGVQVQDRTLSGKSPPVSVPTRHLRSWPHRLRCRAGVQRAPNLCKHLSEKASLAWGARDGRPRGKKLCSSSPDSAHVKMNSVPFKNQVLRFLRSVGFLQLRLRVEEAVFNTRQHEGKFTESHPTTSSAFHIGVLPSTKALGSLSCLSLFCLVPNCQAFKKMHFSPLSLSVI